MRENIRSRLAAPSIIFIPSPQSASTNVKTGHLQFIRTSFIFIYSPQSPSVTKEVRPIIIILKMLSAAARGKLCSPSGRISTRDGWSPLPCLGVRACVRVRVRAGAEKGSSLLTGVAWVAYLLGDGPVIGKFTFFFLFMGNP